MNVRTLSCMSGSAVAKSPRARSTKLVARSVSAVTSATSSMSAKNASCCGERNRAIICWVVNASKWLRRKPSGPAAVEPTAIRIPSGGRTASRTAAPSTGMTPGTHSQRVAVLASTLRW